MTKEEIGKLDGLRKSSSPLVHSKGNCMSVIWGIVLARYQEPHVEFPILGWWS